MKFYKIDLTSLEKAYNSLVEIIERYSNEKNDTAIRDALIQRFEYTYSLAVKFIRKYFEISLDEHVDGMDFNTVIRKANEMGLLLSDLGKWTIFRQARNLTSHTYDEQIAMEVLECIPDFKKDVEFLLNELKKRV